MLPTNDDEIDLFELFEVLWDGKWFISAVIAVSISLGGGFILLKDETYESKVMYSIDTLPPFYDKHKILTDFRKKFYSFSDFEKWKQNNINSPLVFEDFSVTEVVDGFLLSKNEAERLAIISTDETGGSVVIIKSNQLPILDDFFKYATYINDILNKQYIVRAKEELKIIQALLNAQDLADITMIDTVISIERYIVSVEKGAEALSFQHPSKPKKISPKSALVLGLSVFLGGMIGAFFIVVRNAVKKRKNLLAKS